MKKKASRERIAARAAVDEKTGLRSMSRTTAFPATIVARLGSLEARGVRCRFSAEPLVEPVLALS